MYIWKENNKLFLRDKGEILSIMPWGENSLRVMMSSVGVEDHREWALLPLEEKETEITVEDYEWREPWKDGDKLHSGQRGRLRNGGITALINEEGMLEFQNGSGKTLLKEYWRNRNRIDRYAVPLGISARELKAVPGSGEYCLHARFEAFADEKIYGMGQYQESGLNKKGHILELAQRNTQCSVPFYLSDRGYGFLWNNPAIGQVVFGENRTEWTAKRTKKLDYYITCADDPMDIIRQYTMATGRVPMMPEYGLSLWQSKLRYRSQKEVLAVVKEHEERKIPLSVIVVDFFHWTRQGEYRFDPIDWPDVPAMVEKLKAAGIQLMVSIWPTVDSASETCREMEEKGYLTETDRGLSVHMNWMGEARFLDPFYEEARKFVWDLCKEHYYKKGIQMFWLDEAEPEFGPYDFDNYRYKEGSALEVSNLYPLMYAKTFYDGMEREGMKQIVNLVRCAWAGSQRYGALVWSGDVHSSFRAMEEQVQAGISMGIAGIAWWCSDVGGFLGGYPKDEKFRELLVRWFQWSVFCPVLRMHGARQPFEELAEPYRNGVKQFTSGQPNELWSYGDEVYMILRRYLGMREDLKDYVRNCMRQAHEEGLPLIRAMFLVYPTDEECYRREGQYFFGNDILVCPVTIQGQQKKEIYLPKGSRWVDPYTDTCFEGGQQITADTPLWKIPVYLRENAVVDPGIFKERRGYFE